MVFSLLSQILRPASKTLSNESTISLVAESYLLLRAEVQRQERPRPQTPVRYWQQATHLRQVRTEQEQ